MHINTRALPALQALAFALPCAAFSSVYVTQPLLPVLQQEFGVSAAGAALTISSVIAGTALACLPFGWLVDHVAVRKLIGIGGAMMVACCLFIAWNTSFAWLVVARFVQGMFVPALSTTIAVYLARNLDARRLGTAMGAYVAASVAGGLGGRLLGGWVHPPLHWRYAFITTACLIALATLAALRWLPPDRQTRAAAVDDRSYLEVLREPGLIAVFATGAGAFCAFSSMFSFFPFRLAAPPLGLSGPMITSMYLSYIVGIVTSPLAGRASARFGSGTMMMIAAAVFVVGLGGMLSTSLPVLVVSLIVACAGFFALHAAAIGALNRMVSASRGRANALYMLIYYVGGALGVNATGVLYTRFGWTAAVLFNAAVLMVPFWSGAAVRRRERAAA